MCAFWGLTPRVVKKGTPHDNPWEGEAPAGPPSSRSCEEYSWLGVWQVRGQVPGAPWRLPPFKLSTHFPNRASQVTQHRIPVVFSLKLSPFSLFLFSLLQHCKSYLPWSFLFHFSRTQFRSQKNWKVTLLLLLQFLHWNPNPLPPPSPRPVVCFRHRRQSVRKCRQERKILRLILTETSILTFQYSMAANGSVLATGWI